MNVKKKILLFTDWFEPGYKAGGIIRSATHFVQMMKDQYAIDVFTTDRDLHDQQPYKNIAVDQWIDLGNKVRIFYCSPGRLSWKFILLEIHAAQPDIIYLNSMFSRYFTIYPLLMAKRGHISQRIILAPRGMLKASALQFKRQKKNIFLAGFRILGLHKKVHFHATDKTEWQDVQQHFGKQVQLSLVPDAFGGVDEYPGSMIKLPGQLSIVFIGRLHPVKNLHYLLQRLPEVQGNISLSVVGNAEDETYTGYCKRLIKDYSSNIQIRFVGEIPNHQLPEVIAQHHIFAMPTQGENFGHAIFEALVAGRPVMISDQTPWRNLEGNKAGWDIDLRRPEQFTAALQQAVDFDQQQYDAWSKGAWQHVKQFVQQSNLRSAYNKLFS